jgi:hypothetical protein
MADLTHNRTDRRKLRAVIIPFFILAILLTLPVMGYCISPGGGSFTVIGRYTDQHGSSTGATLKESLTRLDLYQTLPGYGRLFLSSDLSATQAAADNNIIALSRYQIGLEGYRLGRWTSSLITGDTSIRFSNLIEGFPGPYPSLLAVKPVLTPLLITDSGRFLNAVYPDVNLRGAVLHSSTESDSLLFFGGALANIRGFQSNEISVTDESLVGTKWKHKWSNGTYAGIGFIQTSNQPLDAAATGNRISNSIVLVDGAWRLNDHVSIIGDYRQNFFSLDGTSVDDWAIKAGPVISFKNGSFEMNYRRVSPLFLFVSNNLQAERDTEGVYTSADYKINPNQNIYTAFDWNRNNLDNNPLLPAANALSVLVGSYFSHPLYPAVNLRFSMTDRSARAGSPLAIDNKTYAIYLETLQSFRLATPYLRLGWEQLDDSAAPINSASTGTVTVGFRTNFFYGLNAYIEGEDKLRDSDSGSRTTTLSAKGGINYVPRPNISCYADGEYLNAREANGGISQKNYSVNSGIMVSLPNEFFINGDVRFNSSQIESITTTNASTFQMTIALTKRFGWGSTVSGAGRAAQGLNFAETGDIEGFLYQDVNHNGKPDPGEPGLANVAILLEDNSKAVTNASGKYVFSNVQTGTHLVRINERQLDASINLLSNASQRVEVKLRETTAVDYSFIHSGSMRGRVLLDTNNNGAADAADAPLPDVLIYLADSRINTFSDSDGNFAFENLMPGHYEVRLDTTGLPEGSKLVTPDRFSVEVKSGDELKDIVFLLVTEKKEIRKKVFGPAAN